MYLPINTCIICIYQALKHNRIQVDYIKGTADYSMYRDERTSTTQPH